MKNIKFVLSLFVLLISINSNAKTIYVSTTGNDDVGLGTINSPYLTLQKALSFAEPNLTVYVRSGVYASSNTVKAAVNGTNGNYIKIWGYPGEPMPIFDFSSQKYVSGSRGFELGKNYWYLKGLVIKGAGDNGVYIVGNNNIVENCKVCFNRDAGIQISNGGSYNYLHNDDCFSNYDSLTDGGNADGIAVKLYPGPGNVLRGCRCWNNSDDGYDLFENGYKVIFDSCWAWHNGYYYDNGKYSTTSSMNGNGFKVGGNYVAGHHRLTNCVAFGNKSKGFDQNNNNGGVTVINCTGYNNGYYNFSFPNDTVRLKDNNGNVIQTFIKEGVDTMFNNVSYKSPGARFAAYHNVQTNNSWNLPHTVSSTDFLSLDTTLAPTDRLPDGTIIQSILFKLNKNSWMVDAGIVFGMPYNDDAPDLGAFETNQLATNNQLIHLDASYLNEAGYLYWNTINQSSAGRYVIQRTNLNIANAGWTDLDSLATTGDSISLVRYSYVDLFKQFGYYEYRIMKRNSNGSLTYSNTVNINTLPVINSTNEFLLYPNPTSKIANLSYYVAAKSYLTVSLFNARGQLINVLLDNHFYNFAGHISMPINMSNLASGMYYLKIKANDGSTIIKNIIKTN